MNTTTERPAPAKHDYDRIPYLVAYQNNSAVRDVYGGIAELVVLESYLLKPRNRVSDTVLVFMHPIGGGAYLPMINALARAGHHVIYCNSRFRGTDSALLMEKVVEDLGECIRDAKERLGYTKVVLAGWSGGGSLSAFYQQQAQRPTVTASPSGDGPDLTQLGLIPADGIMLLAAHISRHGTMTEWLDASILDESDPTRRDPELDLYDPANPNQPPYTAEFLERYRSAQIARNRRITGSARPVSNVWMSTRPFATAAAAQKCMLNLASNPWVGRSWMSTVGVTASTPISICSTSSATNPCSARRSSRVSMVGCVAAHDG